VNVQQKLNVEYLRNGGCQPPGWRIKGSIVDVDDGADGVRVIIE
jgi:hypothetical protein